MDYSNKLMNELISILDKRTAIARDELKKVVNYVKEYDVSITNYIKDDQKTLTNDYISKIGELSTNTDNTINDIRSEIDNKIAENKKQNTQAITSVKNDLNIKLDLFKGDANKYTDNNIDITISKINDVDSKYNGIITKLSEDYDISINDLYDKIKNTIDTLYGKYDASISDFDKRINSSFIQALQYTDTCVGILRHLTLTNAKILEDNLNASINRIKGLIDIDIDDLYTYIDDLLDDVDRVLIILNTSINKIRNDVSNNYEYLLSLISKSSSSMGDIVTDGFAALRRDFNEFKNDTSDNFKSVNDNINSISSDVNRIDKSLNDHINEFNRHIGVYETNTSNINSNINKLNTSVTKLEENLNTLVNTDNANNVIDTFKEVENFLSSISDASTLTGILLLMSTEMNQKIDNIITNDNSIISNINGSLINISTRLFDYINSNNNDISILNSSVNNINSSITKLTENISTSIDNINGDISILNSSVNNINSSITNIYKHLDASINNIDTSINLIDSSISELITNINDISTSIDNINSSIIDISNRLNDDYVTKELYVTDKELIAATCALLDNKIKDISIDVLSTEYINGLNQETSSGFKTIGTCLDFILSTMYYTKPVDLNVTFSVSPSSIIKGKETNVVFTYVINNYKNNISNIVYNGNTLTTLTYTETVKITDNISRSLKVETNYKDNKGASPSVFNKTIAVNAILELYYWSSIDNTYENNYTNENKPNWNVYTYKSNTYSINFNNLGENKYIFFVTSSDIAETKFFIYLHDSSPTIGGGIKKIGVITIQLYNIPLTYYLYRTNNVLGDNYDIKW